MIHSASDSERFISEVKQNAATLVTKFRDQRPYMRFVRSLEDCLANERDKARELKSLYQKHLTAPVFLAGTYFENFNRFERHQAIPHRYFVRGPADYFFISHRWESPKDPDPSGRQFRACQHYYESLASEQKRKFGFWFDFSCLPQRNALGVRNPEEERVFADNLAVLHLLATLSSTIILVSEGLLDRSWCCAEWMFATSISPIIVDKGQMLPWGNAFKFRQIALVVLMLCLEDESKEAFLNDDRYAIPFLNSLLQSTVASTGATFGGDKEFLQKCLHRHWWYHVRYLGLRSEMMIGFLLLDRYDDNYLAAWFAQFLIVSGDPAFLWTRQALVDIDLQLLADADPFKELLFHGIDVQVESRSFFENRSDGSGG